MLLKPIEYDRSELDRLIEAARNHVMTPEEVSEQRVSFVYGQMSGKWSKDQVRDHLVSCGMAFPLRSPP